MSEREEKGVDGLVGNGYFVMEVFTHVQMFFFFVWIKICSQHRYKTTVVFVS